MLNVKKRIRKGKQWIIENCEFINKQIRRTKNSKDTQQCLHLLCPECKGTGIRNNGEMCVHLLSCRCPKCNAHYLSQ